MSPFLAQNKAPKCHSAHPREPIKKRDFFVSKTKTNLTVCHTRRMLRQLTENRDPYESTTKKLSHAEIKHGNCLMDHVPLDSTIETNRELFCLLPCYSSCRSALLLPPGPPPALVPPPATRSYSCCSVLLLPFGPPPALGSPTATRSSSCSSVLFLLALGSVAISNGTAADLFPVPVDSTSKSRVRKSRSLLPANTTGRDKSQRD